MTQATRDSLKVDPLTLAVIDGRLRQIVEEMDLVVVQTAFSTIISEAYDRASGIFEYPSGDTIVQGEIALPIFVGTMEQTIKSTLAAGAVFDPDTIYITNDPYLGGTHLPDVKAIQAVYYEGRPVLLLAVTAHWSDIGATSRILPTSVHEEGLLIPPVAVYRKGVLQQDVFNLLTRNSRLSRDVAGDLEAQLNGLRVGRNRVTEIIAEFGLDTVLNVIAQLRRRAEQMMRGQIAGLPNGTYSFTDHIDNDGTSTAPLTINLAISINDTELELDFTGSSDACSGPLNLPLGATVAACNAALRHVFPALPLNAGCFEPLSYKIPAGSLLDARHPSAVYANYETACRVGDAVFGALFAAAPKRLFAAPVSTGGFHVRGMKNGRMSVNALLQPGGYGGHVDQDGLSGANTPLSMAACTPLEVLEHRSPLRFLQYAFRPDSAGAGTHRGGFGTITEVEVLDGGADVSFYLDRGVHAPWGVDGGLPALGAEVSVTSAANGHAAYSSVAKGQTFSLVGGDRVVVQSCGGGGYGDPLLRAPAELAVDLESGLITPGSARSDYGWSGTGEGLQS